MDNLSAMIRVKRTDRIRNKSVRELVSVCKKVEVINESAMR